MSQERHHHIIFFWFFLFVNQSTLRCSVQALQPLNCVFIKCCGIHISTLSVWTAINEMFCSWSSDPQSEWWFNEALTVLFLLKQPIPVRMRFIFLPILFRVVLNLVVDRCLVRPWTGQALQFIPIAYPRAFFWIISYRCCEILACMWVLSNRNNIKRVEKKNFYFYDVFNRAKGFYVIGVTFKKSRMKFWIGHFKSPTKTWYKIVLYICVFFWTKSTYDSTVVHISPAFTLQQTMK